MLKVWIVTDQHLTCTGWI